LLAFLALQAAPAQAFYDAFRICDRGRLDRLNRTLGGNVLDYTDNHGRDNRIWSQSLGQWRSVYVYIPPGYDGKTQFPAMIWLHGLSHNEKHFLDIVHYFDEGIRAGAFPPTVIIAPDSSLRNRISPLSSGSFYMNTKAGNFEDYIVRDIWSWTLQTFAIRPERDAHLISGASMGGYGAYNLAFKHKELFGQIAGIMPGLDSQYSDCHGRYFADYDPNCVGRRDNFRRNDIIGRFYGIVFVRQGRVLDPLFGRFTKVPMDVIRANNPIEMLSIYDVRPEEFNMFVSYGTKDEFNIDAQVEHFVDVASKRGIYPTVERMEGARHNVKDGAKSFPAMSKWLLPKFAPYVPANYQPMQCCRSEIQLQPLSTASIRPLYLSPLPTSPGTLALR
jgi:hypothetical protein